MTGAPSSPCKGRRIKVGTNVNIGVGDSYAEPDKGYITLDTVALLSVLLRKGRATWSCHGKRGSLGALNG